MTNEWIDFTVNYDYPKEFHDVLLPNGDIVHWCWPNAGLMNGTDKETRKWSPKDGVKVRISAKQPWDYL